MINKVKVGGQTEELGNFIISLKKPTGDFRPRIWIRPKNQFSINRYNMSDDSRLNAQTYAEFSNYYNNASHYVELYMDDTTHTLKFQNIPTYNNDRPWLFLLKNMTTHTQQNDNAPVVIDSYEMLPIKSNFQYAINIRMLNGYTIPKDTKYGIYWYDENKEYISEDIRITSEEISEIETKEIFTSPENAKYCIALIFARTKTTTSSTVNSEYLEEYSGDNEWYKWGMYLFDEELDDYDITMNLVYDN